MFTAIKIPCAGSFLQSTLHQTLCPYCQSSSSIFLRSKDFNRQTNERIFDYYRCPKCKLVFLPQIPDDLKSYYPKNYHHFPESVADLDKLAHFEDFKIKIIEQFTKQGRLLDIGPSIGFFLHLARKAGFEVEALEMDSRCCQFLREKLQIPTTESGDIINSLSAGKCYDIVTLWHVIEHVPDPWNSIKAIVGSLNPGGFLVLAAPNPNSFQFKIFRHLWTHLDAPRHVTLLPIDHLKSFLKSLGMNLVFCTTKDKGSLYWNVFGWQYSLSHLLPSFSSPKILDRLGRIGSLLFSPVEKINGLGSAYTLVFKKDLL